VVDEASMAKLGAAPFVLVVEGQNIKTGLGSRFGTWLLQRGHAPKFDVMAVSKPGEGGIAEHIFHQGLDADSILAKIKSF
jgi:transketolase C-terminal domain/subunit